MPEAPDVIISWLQHDYGRLGRPAEAIAHALVAEGRARRVAYLEPFRPAPGEPELNAEEDRGVFVFSGRGAPPAGEHEVGAAIVATAGLRDPVLFNFGVAEVNWWFHYELAPVCTRTVLVAYDKLALWSAMAPRRARLDAVRRRLVAASDVVCGMSEGSIDDVPEAVYVGHGADAAWTQGHVPDFPEPADLAPIPHPRAVYVGAMSMRFDVGAVAALAATGVHVVLVGLAPSPELLALAEADARVHLIGERPPAHAAAYLSHADVGIVPHTDEPFTRSMEPHKAYNYAAAGLPTVTLNAPHARALDGLVAATGTRAQFTAAVGAALAGGRLGPDQVARARALSWGRVAGALLDAAQGPR